LKKGQDFGGFALARSGPFPVVGRARGYSGDKRSGFHAEGEAVDLGAEVVGSEVAVDLGGDLRV